MDFIVIVDKDVSVAEKRSRTKPSQSEAKSSIAEAALLSLNYLGSFSKLKYKALYFPVLHCCPEEGYSIVAKTSAFDKVLISISGWN